MTRNYKCTESRLMKTCQRLGFDKLAWSFRRLHCPVRNSDRVLEVGSGGNPYYRSNVLLDAYEDTRERHWVPLVSDRPTVLGFVEQLPFRDKSFDFVIASHVLEHSSDPISFLSELERVAKAGYIEVPDAFMERINPYRDHRLEITVRNNCMIIRKKVSGHVDPELVELYESRAKAVVTQDTIRRHPFDFHVRYYWEDKIDFEVLNPEVDANWPAPQSSQSLKVIPNLRQRLGQVVLKFIRTVFSQRRRNKQLCLNDLLACPECRSAEMAFNDESITCNACGQMYPIRNGIPFMHKAGTQ